MATQAGLCLPWSETPEDTFCRVVAHLEYHALYVAKIWHYKHKVQVVYKYTLLGSNDNALITTVSLTHIQKRTHAHVQTYKKQQLIQNAAKMRKIGWGADST